MSEFISPAQAAKISGVSRWTIVRALKNLEIEAHRNNRGHWAIDQGSLKEWLNAQGTPREKDESDSATVSTAPLAHSIDLENARLQVEVRMLREKIEQDKEQAQELANELRSQVRKAEDREREVKGEMSAMRQRTWQKPSWWP